MTDEERREANLACFERLEGFCREIGIAVISHSFPAEPDELAGFRIVNGKIQVDLSALKYPGDLLYYAASIAICHPAFRSNLCSPFHFEDHGRKTSHAMVTSAWCYAACHSLGLPARIVFHEGGYQGQGEWVVQTFEGGQFPGLPLLQLFAMAFEPPLALSTGQPAYPSMTRWLRGNDAHQEIPFAPRSKTRSSSAEDS